MTKRWPYRWGLPRLGGSDWPAPCKRSLERRPSWSESIPANMKRRMRSLGESVSLAQFPRSNPGDNSTLPVLSSAAHARQGVRMQYRTVAGEESARDFDSYGLAFRGGRWYAVGFCHLRKGLRSFRLDRVKSVALQPRQFVRPAQFDVLGHLASSIAILPRKSASRFNWKRTWKSLHSANCFQRSVFWSHIAMLFSYAARRTI